MDTARKPLAIVIPTRNRADVLEAALRTVTAQDVDGLEIIVSDNCSTDHTRDVVASVRDPRVRCIRPDRRLSMSHHWEFALQHARAEWVAVIGDDDGLLPDAVRSVLEIAEDTGVKAIASENCIFKWPGFEDNLYGILSYQAGHWSRVEVREARADLHQVLDNRRNYTRIPMLYTGGFVAMSLIERFRKRHGRFFFSQIPDLFSALAMTAQLERYAFVNRPLAVAGRSCHSTGRASVEAVRNRKSGRTRAWQEFVNERNIPPHPDIPEDGHGSMIIFLPLLVYESALQLVDLGELDSKLRDHSQALEQILLLASVRAKGAMRRKIMEWGRAFAERHDLDFDLHRERALRFSRRWLERSRDLSQRLPQRMRKRKVRGSPILPLRDVHEASTVMAAHLSAALSGMLSGKWWHVSRADSGSRQE